MALMTPKEAAAELGISQDQLLKFVADGKLPYVDMGLGTKRRTLRYEPDDIGALKLARRKTDCPCIRGKAPRHTPTTSGLKVVDFSAVRKKPESVGR